MLLTLFWRQLGKTSIYGLSCTGRVKFPPLKFGKNIRKGDNINYLDFIDKLFATLNKEPSSYVPGTLQEKIDYVMPIFKAIHSIEHKEEKVKKQGIPVICYETGETWVNISVCYRDINPKMSLGQFITCIQKGKAVDGKHYKREDDIYWEPLDESTGVWVREKKPKEKPKKKKGKPGRPKGSTTKNDNIQRYEFYESKKIHKVPMICVETGQRWDNLVVAYNEIKPNMGFGQFRKHVRANWPIKDKHYRKEK